MSVRKNTHGDGYGIYVRGSWKFRFLRLLALLVIACFGLTACGKKEESTTEEPFVVKIGVLLDFSGEAKEESEQMYSAAALAVDEINSAGGVLTQGYKVELVKKDDGGDYMNSVAGYYQLAQEGVCAVIGTNNSQGMTELINASASANVPVITPSVTDDVVVSAASFVYQSCFSDEYMTEALVNFIAAEQGELSCSKAALVCLAESEKYVSLYEDMAASMQSGNINTVYAKEISAYTKESLGEIFDEVVKTGAGIMFIPAPVDELDTIFSTAKECGYEGAFLGLPEWSGYTGKMYGYDVYIPVNMAADREDEAVQSFVKKLGGAVCDGVRPAYDAVYFIRDAIEKGYLATATSVSLKLPFLEGSTALGDYSIGAYGNVEKTVDIILMNDSGAGYAATIFE